MDLKRNEEHSTTTQREPILRPRTNTLNHRASLRCFAMAKKVRVLIAKPGLDGHDRGAKVVARALRDAGMEVIYAGLRQSPEDIVEAAIQEDVDAIGLSSLSGAHMTLFPRVVQLLRKRRAGDIAVVGGGIIPKEDVAALRKAGIKTIFGPGTPLKDIVEFFRAAGK